MVSPETLRRYALFADLTREQLHSVARIAEELRFQAGELILRKGEPADRVYIVIRGGAEVFVNVGPADERCIPITTVSEGEVLGWTALVEERRAASAQAFAETTLLAIDGNALRDLFAHDRDLAAKIVWQVARVISDRLSRMDYQLTSFFDS
jgi:CRP/FNR family cyclic AMP-dependent transcriptional regulator